MVVEERFEFRGGGALLIVRVELVGGRAVRRSMLIESEDGREPWLGLLELVTGRGVLRGPAHSTLTGHPAVDPGSALGRSVRPLGRDQSHTSVVIDDAVLLKLYRALRPGVNPEVELGEALAGDQAAPVPRFRGAVRLHHARDHGRHDRTDVVFVQDFIPDAGDAFESLADRIASWLPAGAPQRALSSLVADGVPAGRAAARLHAALASVPQRHFAPRPARASDVDDWRRRAGRAFRMAVRLLRPVDPSLAAWLGGIREDIERALAPLGEAALVAGTDAGARARTLHRIHADLHLGQLLRDGDRFLIGDLEGEPTRPHGERRRLDTPLRDVASMLRSFDHVARSGLRRSGVPLEGIAAGTSAATAAIEAWLRAIRSEFLGAYAAEAAAQGISADLDPQLLHALEVEKELYEFAYAATYLPGWRYAPAGGLRWLLDAGRT